MITKDKLQEFVDYANENNAVIIYDGAYEAYITDKNCPHSIYQCAGANKCAIEVRSLSKDAGFTGIRSGYTVFPSELIRDGVSVKSLWQRRISVKYNGASYIIQKGAAARFTAVGETAVRELISYYQENAKIIKKGLSDCGFQVFGGVNAPYIWLKTPNNLDSWTFFDKLLNDFQVVGTPGVGFGTQGEGYFRLTAFGTRENTERAVERIKRFNNVD